MFKFSKKFCLFLICFQFCVTLYVVVGKDTESLCGLKKIVRTPKIINGKDAYHGQYPWAVSLRLHRRHHCGGALINKDWVLTAAHCVAQISHRVFTVKLGGHYRNSEIETTSVEIGVKLVVPHESFSFSSFANDIALVKLSKSVDFNNYIFPVCLPVTDTVDYSNQTGVVIGWGKITPSGTSASTLQQVELPIIDNTKCLKWYESQGKVIPIRSSQFCAGLEEGGKDACQGDSGSPMMKLDHNNGQAVAIGIVSAGIGCALPKLPGLYTRIASYLQWIQKTISVNAIPDKLPQFPDISKVINSTGAVHNITVQTGIIHTVPSGAIHTLPTGPIHTLPSGPIHTLPSGPIHTLPSGPIHTLPTGPIHTLPTGPVHIIPANTSHVIIVNMGNITHPNKNDPTHTPTPITTTTFFTNITNA